MIARKKRNLKRQTRMTSINIFSIAIPIAWRFLMDFAVIHHLTTSMESRLDKQPIPSLINLGLLLVVIGLMIFEGFGLPGYQMEMGMTTRERYEVFAGRAVIWMFIGSVLIWVSRQVLKTDKAFDPKFSPNFLLIGISGYLMLIYFLRTYSV